MQELILHTSGSIGEFVEACRPDLTPEGDDDAEIGRRLDAQREFREAMMRTMQPGLTRVLKHMFIDAAKVLDSRKISTRKYERIRRDYCTNVTVNKPFLPAVGVEPIKPTKPGQKLPGT